MSKGNMNMVVVQSDYGLEGRAAQIVGSILATSPAVEVYDVTSAIPKGDVATASCSIYSFFQFYPVGSVCLSLVGEGKPCVVKTCQGRYLVTPDNGTLTAWAFKFPFTEIREVDLTGAPKACIPLAWAAARLASGQCTFEQMGPAYSAKEVVLLKVEPARVKEGVVECGVFSLVRNFGNLNLGATYEEFEKSGICFGDHVNILMTRDGVKIFNEDLLYERSFGFTKPGAPILFNGSTGYMGLGLNLESFVAAYMPEALEDGVDLSKYELVIRKL
jgi:S-adenosylmethionine hydrolase